MEFRESPTEKRAKEMTAPVVEAEVIELELEPTPAPTPSPVKTTKTKTTTPSTSRGQGVEMIVYYLTGLVEVALVIRLILAISNPDGSTGFVYRVVDPLTRPFYDLFYTTGGHEPGVGIILLAMLVYGLLGWGVGRLLRAANRV
jgi:uncharacterized protein YggT (Ycf19 family)